MGTAVGQQPTSFLLSNATIIDGRAHVAPYVGAILIDNGRIKKISHKPIRVAKHVQQIDCTDKYIVPGLFDAHIHLATGDLSDWDKAKKSTDKILLNMLCHGITTVRDMAGDARYLAAYKSEIEKGLKAGPDIFYAAQFAGPSYFELFSRGTDKKMGVHPWERAITDTTDVDKVVKEAKMAGVTAIKTYAELSAELLEKITKSAKKQGLLVWSHATVYPIKPSDAVNLSVHSISHAADVIFEQIPSDSLTLSYAWQKVYAGMQVDAEKLKPLFLNMKKNHVYFDPTVYHATNNKLNYATEILKLAHASAVKIVAGTDWIYPEENEMVPLYNEVLLYKEKAGMNSMAIIESLTYNAALVTGLKDRGYLAQGLRADLLVLSSNPLEELSMLFKPEKVVQAGRIIN